MDEGQTNEVSGRARGGVARVSRLSAEERSAISSKAARRRWEARDVQPGPKVLPGFSGVLNLGGITLPCAVITGPQGIQRVLTEHGVTNVILGSRSGASKRRKREASGRGEDLPLFLAPKQLRPYITTELEQGVLQPIDYLDGERTVRGYEATILAAVCKVWLDARRDDALLPSQHGKARVAELLMSALANTGIVALVDEATGYEKIRPQNALQAYIDQIISKELAAWAKKFPDEFYENIYKLKSWTWPGMKRNRYSVVAHYTRDLIYSRMGPGVLQELERKTPKNDSGNRSIRFHQWLTEDVGDPMLAQHLTSVITLQRLAIANGHGWRRFVHTVDQVLPRLGDNMVLPLDIDGNG